MNKTNTNKNLKNKAELNIKNEIEELNKISEKQKEVIVGISNTLKVLYKGEAELKKYVSILKVEYKISTRDDDYILFAYFKVNKGLTKLEKTFVVQLWHEMCGYEGDESKHIYLQMNNFIELVKKAH